MTEQKKVEFPAQCCKPEQEKHQSNANQEKTNEAQFYEERRVRSLISIHAVHELHVTTTANL
jgi:hypothetical protein